MNKILDGSFDDRVFNLYKTPEMWFIYGLKQEVYSILQHYRRLIFLKTDFLQNCICMSEIGNQESVMVKENFTKIVKSKIKTKYYFRDIKCI